MTSAIQTRQEATAISPEPSGRVRTSFYGRHRARIRGTLTFLWLVLFWEVMAEIWSPRRKDSCTVQQSSDGSGQSVRYRRDMETPLGEWLRICCWVLARFSCWRDGRLPHGNGQGGSRLFGSMGLRFVLGSARRVGSVLHHVLRRGHCIEGSIGIQCRRLSRNREHVHGRLFSGSGHDRSCPFFHASRLQILFKVLVPFSLSYIVTGLRLGVGRGLTGVVVGEFFFRQRRAGISRGAGRTDFQYAFALRGSSCFCRRRRRADRRIEASGEKIGSVACLATGGIRSTRTPNPRECYSGWLMDSRTSVSIRFQTSPT